MRPTARDRRLLLQYGITGDEYDKILASQGGACAICRRYPVRIRLGVDHNHRTGEVRGLVCMLCNRGLRMFRDDVTLLGQAGEYLVLYLARKALGFQPIARVGRVGRKWRTKKERAERMSFVAARLLALSSAWRTSK